MFDFHGLTPMSCCSPIPIARPCPTVRRGKDLSASLFCYASASTALCFTASSLSCSSIPCLLVFGAVIPEALLTRPLETANLEERTYEGAWL